MTDTTSQPQVITDGQAALIEVAQLRVAAQRMKLAKKQAGKLLRTTA